MLGKIKFIQYKDDPSNIIINREFSGYVQKRQKEK
jgi:hypothetical protein